MPYNPNRKKSLVVALDGEGRDKAVTLIAGLIVTDQEAENGAISHVATQGKFKLKPEMLHPGSMGFERAVLRTIYTLESQKMPATFNNILARVQLEYPDDAEQKLWALFGRRSGK